MPENIGRMDRPVIIEQSSVTRDDYGEPIHAWEELAKVWAREVQIPRGELTTAQQRVAVKEVQYRMRYRSDVNERMRLLDGGSTYYITRIQRIGRNEAMIITAESRDNHVEG